MASARPVLLILPGGSQNPTHYGYLAHLLQSAGYPTSSALFPSAGNSGKIGSQDDADFFRDRLILPYLDQGQDVVLIMHSYSGLPGSAAALGLSKAERAAQGKKGGVIGQIYYAALLQKGGDGTDLLTALGGKFPPFLQANEETNSLTCADPIPPLYTEVPSTIASASAASIVSQCMTVFHSPSPRSSWDSEYFKDRVAYIKTLNDASVPAFMQQMMIDNAVGPDWKVREIQSDHAPQLSHPEKFTEVLLELIKGFEEQV